MHSTSASDFFFEELLLDTEKGEFQLLAADPYTWAWVGQMLAEGAIAWVGGKTLEKILGAGVDFEELLKKFTLAVQAIVRAELSRDALREALADLKSVENQYLDYLKSKDIEFLNRAENGIEVTVNRIRSLGFVGHHAFISAQGIQLAILQERRGADDEFRSRIVDRAHKAAGYLDKLHTEWYNWHESRYKIRPYIVGGDPLRPRFMVLRDGQPIKRGLRTTEDAEQFGRSQKSKDWEEDVFPNNILKSLEIGETWKSMS